MSKTQSRPVDDAFLDSMASLMAPWGWSRPVGRMYGYLLLQDEPVTLDRMAADLGIAKSNASVAARTLEQCCNARRHSEPGTKRITYSAPRSPAGPFVSRVELLAMLEALLSDQIAAGQSGQVTERLADMTDFFSRMREAMQRVLAETRRPDQAVACAGTEMADVDSSLGSNSATRAR